MTYIDTSFIAYVEDEQWRVLQALEQGQRNHEIVPEDLVAIISKLRGSIFHHLQFLLRHRLIVHVGKPYNGYSIAKLGYDYLALHTLMKRGIVANKLGSCLGRGKEADVFHCFDPEGNPIVLKFHRLGRTSFKKAKSTRHYLNKKNTSSWLYLSRVSAKTEFKNMVALQEYDFPIPTPIDHNRNCTVMTFVDGTLLNNVSYIEHPDVVFGKIIDLAFALLKKGVVHADFSEFNIMIDEDENITLIDFPQCIPYTFPEAEDTFNHDMNELRRYFELRFKVSLENFQTFTDFIENNEIEPIDIIQHTKKSNNDDEDEEDEKDYQQSIQERVSKEKRFKRRIVRTDKTKPIQKIKKEAQCYE